MKVYINVYKIAGVAPLWHSGIVINDREYFFDTDNRVRTTSPRGMSGVSHHRTIERNAEMKSDDVQRRLADVINEWDGSRYDLTSHNCNFFVDAVLKRIGAGSHEREYLVCSGLAEVGKHIPGAHTGCELVKSVTSGRVDWRHLGDAVVEDVVTLPRAMATAVRNVHRETERAAKDIGKGISRAFGF